MSMSARPLASGSYSALPVLLSKYETATVRGAWAAAGGGRWVAAHSVAESDEGQDRHGAILASGRGRRQRMSDGRASLTRAVDARMIDA